MPVLGFAPPIGISTPRGWFDVQNYGAYGDNSHDDTAAIQAAITAIKATASANGSVGGKTLYFPPGFYKTTSRLDLTLINGLRILGGSGRGGWDRFGVGGPPTAIYYQGGGSGVAVDLGGSQECIWDGVSIWSNIASFSGTMMNFNHTVNGDVYGNRLQNMQFNCLLGNVTQLRLAGSIEFSADNVSFSNAGATGTQVQMVHPAHVSQWSNANSFRSCSFIGTKQYSVLNPGPQTTFVDCTWEHSGPVAYNAVGNEEASTATFTG